MRISVWVQTCALPIFLFWIAVVTAFATFVSVVGGMWDMLTSGVSNPYQSHSPNAFFQLLLAFGTALSSAAWPFFGAALLWLLDRKSKRLNSVTNAHIV